MTTSTSITAGQLETVAVTFAGTFLTDLALFGATLTASAELAGIAALGVLGYHYVSDNVTTSTTPPATT